MFLDPISNESTSSSSKVGTPPCEASTLLKPPGLVPWANSAYSMFRSVNCQSSVTRGVKPSNFAVSDGNTVAAPPRFWAMALRVISSSW